MRTRSTSNPVTVTNVGENSRHHSCINRFDIFSTGPKKMLLLALLAAMSVIIANGEKHDLFRHAVRDAMEMLNEKPRDLFGQAVVQTFSESPADFAEDGTLRLITMGILEETIVETVSTAFPSSTFTRIPMKTEGILVAEWTWRSAETKKGILNLSLLEFSAPSAWSTSQWEEFVLRVQGQCPWGAETLERCSFPRSLFATFCNLSALGQYRKPAQIYVNAQDLGPGECQTRATPHQYSQYSELKFVAFQGSNALNDLIPLMVERARQAHTRRVQKMENDNRAEKERMRLIEEEAETRRQLKRHLAQDETIIKSINEKYEKQIDQLVATQVEKRIAALLSQVTAVQNQVTALHTHQAALETRLSSLQTQIFGVAKDTADYRNSIQKEIQSMRGTAPAATLTVVKAALPPPPYE